MNLFHADKSCKSLTFSLNAIKPGIVSKNFEVAQWACRLFSKIAFEIYETNLLIFAWEWFVGDNGGFHTVLLGMKRHPDLRELVLSILL